MYIFCPSNRPILHNIDLNTKDIHGWTPFMKACINGHTDVIKSTNPLILKFLMDKKIVILDQCIKVDLRKRTVQKGGL